MKVINTNDNEQFITLIQRGVDSWVLAGELAARKIEQDPEWPEKIAQENPWISQARIMDFVRLGRKQVHPRLLLSDRPGPRALTRLPMQLQEKYISAPVELLIKTEKGWETLLVDICNLTPDQCRQVFDRDGIRDIAGQRAWIESQKLKQSTPEVAVMPWKEQGGKIVILQPCTLTTRELARMLAAVS
jgi:hypothetical protein